MRTPTIRELTKLAREVIGRNAKIKVDAHAHIVAVYDFTNLKAWTGAESTSTARSKRLLRSILLLEKLLASPDALQNIRAILRSHYDEMSPERECESGMNTPPSVLRTRDAIGVLLELLGEARHG